MSHGKVYLVGAGPGDIDLITLKGYQLICQADVILYDHLSAAGLLDFARADAEKIAVGKFASRHTMPQDEINSLLIEKARTNQVVVRLKGGDPYLFGRGGEEAEACVDAGVDFEVVPGVTSALAGACYAGIPPTHRDYTCNVAIVTGHRKDELEIGPLYKGQGIAARESYADGIAKVLLNARKFMIDDFDVFLVANDKWGLYPSIAEKAEMKIVNQYKRPVLNRTERDKNPYSEIIFHLKRA